MVSLVECVVDCHRVELISFRIPPIPSRTRPVLVHPLLSEFHFCVVASDPLAAIVWIRSGMVSSDIVPSMNSDH